MTPRRNLTFSLRTLFILLTALAVWLGIVVNRAREQREAVKAIEALGGRVQYDWEQDLNDPFGEPYGPGGPGWLRKMIGDDFFQDVRQVSFEVGPNTTTLIKHLQRMERLNRVLAWCMSEKIDDEQAREELEQLRAELPGCEILVKKY